MRGVSLVEYICFGVRANPKGKEACSLEGLFQSTLNTHFASLDETATVIAANKAWHHLDETAQDA